MSMDNEPLILDKLREHGLAYLADDPDELGIKVKRYDVAGLIVLNYCQIKSPKENPIIRECRGLIVSYPECKVVSRSFDRFFNYGEAENETFDLQPDDTVMEKVDGSLVKIYWCGGWRASTRGTAYAESEASEGVTFAELVGTAFPALSGGDPLPLDPSHTYLFELTAPENRVVRNHAERSLTYLATRHNRTGQYVDHGHLVKRCGITHYARTYSFGSVDECVEAARELPDLEEGYVVYRDGQPVCKIKSPAYVAAHRLFSGPLTAKRVAEMVLLNETPEFITYFPEFAELFEDAADRVEHWLARLDRLYAGMRGADKDLTQKEFALLVKDRPDSAVLFRARAKGVLPSAAWDSCKGSFQQHMVVRLLDGLEGLANPTEGTD